MNLNGNPTQACVVVHTYNFSTGEAKPSGSSAGEAKPSGSLGCLAS